MVHGSAESGAVKDLGKPGAGEPHARFDERGLETEPGRGTAEPAACCVDSAGPPGHRASPRLYPLSGPFHHPRFFRDPSRAVPLEVAHAGSIGKIGYP